MVNMGDVWDRTTEFLSDNLAALLPIAAVALFVPQSIGALVAGAGPAVQPIVAHGLQLACILIALWGQLAVVALALDPDRGRAGAAAAATASFPRAVVVMLVLFAAAIVLALPIIAVLFASGVDLNSLGDGGLARANLSGGAAGFVSLYAIALTLVAVFVVIRTAMLYPVLVAEGSMIASIRRSFALSRGIVWKLIGVWLLFIVVYLVASAAVTMAIGAVLGLLTPMTSPFGFGKIVVALLGGLVATIFTLIVGAFYAKLYRAVLATREGAATA